MECGLGGSACSASSADNGVATAIQIETASPQAELILAMRDKNCTLKLVFRHSNDRCAKDDLTPDSLIELL